MHRLTVVDFLDKFDLFEQPIHQDLVCILQVLLDKARHHDVATHVDFFAQIQAITRCIDAEFARFPRFSWHVAADRPFRFDIQAGGSVAVCLESERSVEETCFVLDLALDSG